MFLEISTVSSPDVNCKHPFCFDFLRHHTRICPVYTQHSSIVSDNLEETGDINAWEI